MGFEKLFDHVFSSADIEHKKPEKEFYKFILDEIKNEHKINPHEIMFFDDSQENVVEAKNLDINTHFYKNLKSFFPLRFRLWSDKSTMSYFNLILRQ